MTFRKLLLAAIAATSGVSSAAMANLVTNGSFEQTTFTTNSQIGGPYAQGVTGWTGNGFNLFFFGNALTTSAANQYNDPGNKLNANVPNSPDGGNLIAMDGDTGIHGALSQDAEQPRCRYQLCRDLRLGRRSVGEPRWRHHGTARRDVRQHDAVHPDRGRTRRRASPAGSPRRSCSRQPARRRCCRSFRDGTPNGYPPVALLDGVSAVAAPEPAGFGAFALGAAAIGGLVAFRRRSPNGFAA